MTITIQVGRKNIFAQIPDWLPRVGWSLHSKGYLIYTSRKTGAPLKRGERASRKVVETLAGHPLTSDEHVHHQDFNKLNNCGCNLVLLPAAFNLSCACRDPYTGEYMEVERYKARYGVTGKPATVTDEVPEWVRVEEAFGSTGSGQVERKW